MRSTLILILLLAAHYTSFSQEIKKDQGSLILLDSLKRHDIIFDSIPKSPVIQFSTDQSIRYLQQKIRPEFWKNSRDPLRIALGQLVFNASHPSPDSAEMFLNRYPYDSIRIPWDKFYTWEQIKLKIPVVTNPPAMVARQDSSRTEIKTDSLGGQHPEAYKNSLNVAPHTSLKDTTILVLVDTLNRVVSAYKDFPFSYYDHPFEADSIEAAVKSLLEFTASRDSSLIKISGAGKGSTEVWLNSRSGRMQRFWLRNGLNDSVTIWIGSNARKELNLFLEDGVSFRRPVKEGNYSQARVEIKEIDRSKLLNVKQAFVRQNYWRYRTEASFALNQTQMSNWVKGGESSVSTAFDITGYADYENKSLKVNSSNFARIKYGLVAAGFGDSKWDIRKNIDLIETNSKVNHKAFGKFDFSAILLIKTQVGKNYNYPNDSVPVSKFFNPAIITAGIGLDYKPNKTTSINFSPLSYKGTFVPDTIHIDKSKYGIPAGHRALNEPGVSFLVTNEFKPVKTVTITNRLQLFTNYIHNPQNVDVDWEMIATASLNWFTDVRLNTHLIFDDDTKTTVMKDGQPVLKNGKPWNTARVQFKELLGFSLMFRF